MRLDWPVLGIAGLLGFGLVVCIALGAVWWEGSAPLAGTHLERLTVLHQWDDCALLGIRLPETRRIWVIGGGRRFREGHSYVIRVDDECCGDCPVMTEARSR